MKTLIKKTFVFVVIIGCFALATGLLTGAIANNLSIVQHKITYINGWQWDYYTIDLGLYLRNLEGTFDINNLPSINLENPQLPIWPNLSWSIENWFTNLGEVFKAISKYVIYGLNWLIYVSNTISNFFKVVIIYPVKALLTLFGLNTSDNSFYEAIETIYEFGIPYIPINY